MLEANHYPRSLTSHVMEKLMTWRNPHGDEVNWFNGSYEDDDNGIPYDKTLFQGRRIGTELALPVLAIAAIIEGVAYVALGMLIIFTPFPERWSDRVLLLSDSAFFTAGWSMTSLFNNFIYTNLSTKEAFASINFAGGTSRDRRYQQAWMRKHRPQVYEELTSEYDFYSDTRKTKAGAGFLIEEIIKPYSKDLEFMDSFASYDHDLYLFLLVKSFAVYLSGKKKKAGLPHFFKKTTLTRLKELRASYSNKPEEHQNLLQATSSWAAFKNAKKDIHGTLLHDLWVLQGQEQKKPDSSFLFIGDCWQEALKHPLFVQPQQ